MRDSDGAWKRPTSIWLQRLLQRCIPQATEGVLGRAKAEAEGLRRAARQQAEHAEVLQRDCTALTRKVAEVEAAVTSSPELPQVRMGVRGMGRIEVGRVLGGGPGYRARFNSSDPTSCCCLSVSDVSARRAAPMASVATPPALMCALLVVRSC